MTDFHNDVKDKSEASQRPSTIELFVQGEGAADMLLLTLAADALVADVVTAMRAKGLCVDGEIILMVEDDETELPHDRCLVDLHIGHRHRLHGHRCHRVQVSVTYNGTEARAFPPSATVASVKRWVDKEFGLKGHDATDLVLQVSGTTFKPDEDVHIGTLVKHPVCELCFELVPKHFVQG